MKFTERITSTAKLVQSLGLAMLLFCFAPVHAQSEGFKSTSAYQLNASVQKPNAVNQYNAYRSTIYQPFSESAPSNNGPSGGPSKINDRRNAVIGIPGWGDTMSEPLPIGDTVPLFLFAAAMIAIILIKQRRKQKQLSTQTSNNNSNNDTNEMTLTQHNGKSFRKLLMLALLLCVVGEVTGQNYSVTELFNYSRTKGNLPANFPTGSTGNYYYAHQATYINDAFYTNDGTNKIIKITKNGVVSEWAATQANPGLQYGTCRDDAGNLIVNTSNYPRQPQTITVYPNDGNGPTTTGKTKITLSETIYGRCNYISAKGNVLSGTGYIYFFPGQINSGDAVGQNLVKIATITDGACTSITTHTQLSVTSDACGGYVIPIDGLNHYIYNERSTSGKGYYLYNDGDQGALMPDVAYNDVAPTRNATYGGAYFTLGDHKMFVYGSGVNYAGGWTMRDLSNGLNVVHNEGNLRGSLDGNQTANENNSYAAFFTYERVNDHTVKLYEYCLGMGIAGWEICDNDYKNFKYRVQTCESGNVFDTKTCDATGGSLEMTATDGKSLTISKANGNDQGYQYISHHNDVTITCTAESNDGYVFIGWWNNDNGQIVSNPWKEKAGNMDDYVTARFASVDNVTTQTINVSGSGSATITRNLDHASRQSVTTTQSVTVNAWKGTSVTLVAEADQGHTFLGWYDGQNLVSKELEYTYTATEARNITAYFAEGTGTTTLQVRAMEWNGSKLVKSDEGGTFTLTHSGGVVYAYQEQASDYHHVLVANSPATFQATIYDGYEFIGWFNSSKGQFLDNPWIMQNPGNSNTYDKTVTAVFASNEDYAYKQTIKIEGPGTVTANYTYYTTSTREVTFEQSSSFVAWNSTSVKLTATPLAGYEFDGWYEGGNKINTGVSGNTLTYTASSARTITAKFKIAVNKLTVSVLNYNTSYNEFREYEYEYNKVTLKQGSSVLKESYSSFSYTFDNEASVTITATPEDGDKGYDFIGWFMNDTLVSDDATYTMEVVGLQAISARFAPKQCHKLSLMPNSGGTYTVHYGKDKNTYPNNFYSVESSLTDTVIAYMPYEYNYTVSSAKPILGYKFKHHDASPLSVNYNDWKDFGKFHSSVLQADHFVVVSFVRDEEQVVYLDLNNKWDDNNSYKYWVFAYDTTRIYTHTTTEQGETKTKQGTFKWIPMTTVTEGSLYTCTLPADTFSHIAFIQLTSTTNPTTHISQYSACNQTKFFTIPATRYNCMRLQWAWNSTTSSFEDAWTDAPTEEGDYRLIYIEQTVISDDSIRIDYDFSTNADLIKKRANGKDIVSLHIYNKVSDDFNGMNNPEIILQRCTGFPDGKSQWEDVERHLVFGPLRFEDAGSIRMPRRKNATVVGNLGISNIIDSATPENDYACGVWNFTIQQNADGTSATLLLEETEEYEGNYYIRTTNAPGQYNNYTHPGNIISESEYAKNHSNYSHYYIRDVNINEDGTPTGEAGKHPLVKFAIANDYARFLNYELLIEQKRFADDNYTDVFVKNDNGSPNLPADASVRFGWDIVTNRLTRAYIANTTIKNNEYLVVEGTNIGNPSGDAAYFTDNSNWLYSIDLPNATAGAAAKVKAKMNGEYQYFMGAEPGSQNEYESLISGNGTNTYPIRLLYDFKDDRFTTIYRPSGQLNGDISVNTPLMIEREHNDAPTQIQLTTNTVTSTGTGEDQYTQPAYAVMTFLEEKLADAAITHHEKMFYWVSFPFDVKISNVFGLGDYGQYWIMQYYDGAQRALHGLAQTNWKYILDTEEILEANKGYIICLNYNQILQDQLFKSYGSNSNNLGEGKLSLYFPSNGVVSHAAIKQQDPVVVNLDAHPIGANIAWNHWNWHVIGVPSFADPDFRTTQGDVPFFYQYWHPTDGYAAVASTEVDFYAMHSYMVQYAGEIEWSKIVNIAPSGLAAKKNSSAIDKIMLRLELQQAGNMLDKTYVQLRNDKGTLGFDLNLDLSKVINAGANIYSVVSGDQMAGNAIPKEETVIPIGVVITAAGEYTFAMPNGTGGMIVELIDYEQGTSTNLLAMDYTVNLPKATNNTRFALRLKPNKVATSVENIGEAVKGINGEGVRKLLIDGVLYLQKGNLLYDAQGRCVQ